MIIAVIAIISLILQFVFTVNIAEDKGEPVGPWIIVTIFLGWIGVLILYLSTRSQYLQQNDSGKNNEYEKYEEYVKNEKDGKVEDPHLREYLDKQSNKEQVDWCCECGTRNPIYRKTCSTCGKERIDKTAKKQIIDDNGTVNNEWFCTCGARNPQDRNSCLVCGKSKSQ